MAFCLVCLGILAKNMPKHLAGYYLLNSYNKTNIKRLFRPENRILESLFIMIKLFAVWNNHLYLFWLHGYGKCSMNTTGFPIFMYCQWYSTFYRNIPALRNMYSSESGMSAEESSRKAEEYFQFGKSLYYDHIQHTVRG